MTILTGCLLSANALFAFNRQDSLRGGNGRGRDWWDVQHYNLVFRIDKATKSIKGKNTIRFKIVGLEHDSMQIDLQEPMILDSAIFLDDFTIDFAREGNVYWLDMSQVKKRFSSQNTLTLYYHGKPKSAVKPPWDGGLISINDSFGKPWISVACQGLGASSWWPCKDFQADEPDRGIEITSNTIRLNATNLDFISNGIKTKSEPTYTYSESIEEPDSNRTILILKEDGNYYHTYTVSNPINSYNVAYYQGDYSTFTDTFKGKKGVLNLTFHPLSQNERKAKKHFKQVKKMLEAFEYWFGPYPFYEDGYKIVEAPFLGMEHQSAIAYGNQYQMGYQGKDRSGTGVGLMFDFIIVHESGHEWFGNSITAADIADNWIHEGFTTYSETLFAEYWFGKEKAFEYCRGEWKNISNDRNVIGTYGVNDAGSSDKYDKGSALVHTIRLLMNDDEKFRAMLHQMNDTFYHRQITTKQMEDFIMGFSGLQLKPIFEQYLRSTMIPELQWRKKGKQLEYRFVNTVPGFTLPVTLNLDGKEQKLQTTAEWQSLTLPSSSISPTFPPEFLIRQPG